VAPFVVAALAGGAAKGAWHLLFETQTYKEHAIAFYMDGEKGKSARHLVSTTDVL
jgi:hypothetical protein